ncbi:MAG: type pilus assembly protein PilM [Planctomycetota bacterium]|jgi:type IV pilus assembly protein PilM
MDAFPVAWGLDIGHASIKAVKLARAGDGVTVLGYAIEPLPQGEGIDRDKTLVAALAQLAAREEFGSTPVIAALSGKQVFARTVNVPMLGTKNLDRIVELEARQQIPGDFDSVEWGYHLCPGADGASYDVALFAVKREIIQELIDKTKGAGINLMGVAPSSLALCNFVRYDQNFPGDETVIILDVGAENSDLVFYQGDTLSIGSLDTCGADITRAFMKKFRVSFEEAEKLKREVGDSRQAERIIKVIEGSLNDLVAGVQRRIGFHKSQRPDAKLENLVISGNTFRMPGLPEYMAERLRYTVNILEDLDRIKIDPGLPKDHFMHDLQGLGTALGLALQGTGSASAKVNLMPSQLRVQRLMKTKRWAGIAAVALLGIGLGSTWSIKQQRLDDNAAIKAKIETTAASNSQRSKASTEMLGTVAQKAATLRQFADIGMQQGAASAPLDAVLGLLEESIRKLGAQRDPSPTPSANLQAIFLESLAIPDYAMVQDPFRPLAVARSIELAVRIPANERSSAMIQALQADLRKLPVPDVFRSRHPAWRAWSAAAEAARARGEQPPPEPPLFREVQTKAETEGSDTYWYVDEHNLDAAGNLAPLRLERRIAMRKVTVTCTFGGEAQP